MRYTFAALVILCVAAMGFAVARPVLSAQAAGQAPAQAAATAKPQMAEQVYKDIQVLKGIPVDEFIGTMGVFSTSLTLCCGNCHEGAGTATFTVTLPIEVPAAPGGSTR